MGTQNQDNNEKSGVNSHPKLIRKITNVVVFLAGLATIITLFIAWKQSDNGNKNAATVVAIAIEQRNLLATIADAGNITVAQQATLIMLNEQQAKIAPYLATVPIPTMVTPSTAQTYPPTIAPSPTIIPTETKISPTNTPIPSPTPEIVLPFTDNFDNGTSPAWKVISGSWLIVNGRYTVLPTEADVSFFDVSLLPNPQINDYRIGVDVYPDHYGGYGTLEAILFRIPSSNSNYLGFIIASGDAHFAIIGQDYDHITSIAGDSGYKVAYGSKVMVDVQGNTFTAKINGRVVQKIVFPGYETGGVGLMSGCWFSTPCSGFDNFSLEPLP